MMLLGSAEGRSIQAHRDSYESGGTLVLGLCDLVPTLILLAQRHCQSNSHSEQSAEAQTPGKLTFWREALG
jgi:hypothetical protein